jgi:hypothetical protein
MTSLHGPESWEQVLDDPSHDMAYVGLVVGGGRTLEEDEVLTVTGLLQGLFEDPVLPPLEKDPLFECGKGIA